MITHLKSVRGWLAGLATVAVMASGWLVAGEGGWVALFNGRDLSGWKPMGEVTFDVTEGNLRLVKGVGWLRTEREYQDFVLEWECRGTEEQYDGGLLFRVGLEGEPWPTGGWQVNLKYNANAGLMRGNTSIEPSPIGRTAVGKWTQFRLEVNGKRAVLTVDGEEGWEVDQIDREKGYIGIQAEGKAFEFRKIRLQEL
jgi:hypothetical protein